MQLEFAPYINRIISPTLRPVSLITHYYGDPSDHWPWAWQVNSQVVKPEERTLLTRLVNIMTTLELRFIQERSEEGQLVYRLDPWVALTQL